MEADPFYRQVIDASHAPNVAGHTQVPDAVCCAMRRAVALLRATAIVSCTHSGHTSLRAARERPEAPILSLTPQRSTARRLSLAWGVHSLHIPDVAGVEQMTAVAGRLVLEEGFAQPGDIFVAIAGIPFGASGTTNLMRIAHA